MLFFVICPLFESFLFLLWQNQYSSLEPVNRDMLIIVIQAFLSHLKKSCPNRLEDRIVFMGS